MASLKDIKGRMRSIDSTKKITNAMNLVATSKLNKAKIAALQSRPFFHKILSTMQSIAKNANEISSPLLGSNDSDKKLIIALAADRGLCGGYNANICKMVMHDVEDKTKAEIVVVGKKGKSQFASKGYTISKEILGVSESPTYSVAKEIADHVINKFGKGEVGEVYLAYTAFKSSIQQEPVMIRLLPIDMNNVEEEEAKQKNLANETELGELNNKHIPSDVLMYEPSPEAVLGYVIPRYIADMVYGAMVESAASEQGARMTAMDSATENAEEIIAKLDIQYNRARQAAITQELTEIVGGAEALK